FLRGLTACKGQTGLNMVVNLILGRANQQTKKRGLDKSKEFGIGCHRSEAFWKALSRELENKNLCEQVSKQMSSGMRYFAWRTTDQGKTFRDSTIDVFQLELPLPKDLADSIKDADEKESAKNGSLGSMNNTAAGRIKRDKGIFLPGVSGSSRTTFNIGVGAFGDTTTSSSGTGAAPFLESTQVDELFDELKQLRLVYGRGKNLPDYIKSGPFLRNLANVRPSSIARCVHVEGYAGGIMPSLLEKFIKVCCDFCRRHKLPADNFLAPGGVEDVAAPGVGGGTSSSSSSSSSSMNPPAVGVGAGASVHAAPSAGGGNILAQAGIIGGGSSTSSATTSTLMFHHPTEFTPNEETQTGGTGMNTGNSVLGILSSAAGGSSSSSSASIFRRPGGTGKILGQTAKTSSSAAAISGTSSIAKPPPSGLGAPATTPTGGLLLPSLFDDLEKLSYSGEREPLPHQAAHDNSGDVKNCGATLFPTSAYSGTNTTNSDFGRCDQPPTKRMKLDTSSHITTRH
ncbi:unnamed protein product, partial [Amoebophrya sp. A25]